MSPLLKLRLAIARALIPDYLLPSPQEVSLIRSLLDPNAAASGDIEDSRGFHHQVSTVQVQFDLETWGLEPGSALRSIGACVSMPYDVHGLGGRTFKRNVTLDSCLGFGLTQDPETVAWWDKQSDAAKHAAQVDAVPLDEALRELNYWLTQIAELAQQSDYTLEHGAKIGYPPAIAPYGNGATLDISLLEAAYRAAVITPVWKFWDIGDTRTVVRMGRFLGLDDRKVPRTGLHHEAAEDARHDGARTATVQRAVTALAKIGVAIIGR